MIHTTWQTMHRRIVAGRLLGARSVYLQLDIRFDVLFTGEQGALYPTLRG